MRLPPSMFLPAVCLLLAITSLSSPAQTASGPDRPGLTQPASRKPLISQSHIVAPRSLAAFRLTESSYDSKEKGAGAMFRYASVPEPGLSADVFVYPAGRAPQADAIKRGMDDFRVSLESAQRAGYFQQLRIVEESDFPLIAASAPRTDHMSPTEAMLADTALRGRRLDMTLNIGKDARPFRSRGYLFYKQLHYYKVRVSAPVAAMDAEAFSVFADHAARTLVAGIDTLNIGACGDHTIRFDSKASSAAAGLDMARQLMEQTQENCQLSVKADALDQRARGADRVTIEYTPEDWGIR